MLSAFKYVLTPRRTLLPCLKIPGNIPACPPRRFLSTLPFSPNVDSKSAPKHIRELIVDVKAYLQRTSKQESAIQFVNDRLDKFIHAHTENPRDAYEQLLTFLIHVLQIQAACSIYERMHREGFLTSSDTDAKMLAVVLATTKDTDHEPYLQGLKRIFQHPNYSEHRLRYLMELMSKLDAPQQVQMSVLEQFTATREEGYRPSPRLLLMLVGMLGRAGEVDDAFNLISWSGAAPSGGQAHYPYVALLHALKDGDDADAVKRVLKLLNHHKIAPRIEVFNTIITREVRQRDIGNAFAFYAVAKKAPNVYPDTFTFASLFKGLDTLFEPKRWRAKGRRTRSNDSVLISPRELYHEMLSALGDIPAYALTPNRSMSLKPGGKPPSLSRTPSSPSSALTSSLLNVALRTFLYKHDFAAALVVIRSFTVYDVPLVLGTYAIVLRYLSSRIHKEIRSLRTTGEQRWADNFLGLPQCYDPRRFKDIETNNQLLTHILAVVRQPRGEYDAGTPLYVNPHAGQTYRTLDLNVLGYDVPTLDMLSGEEEVPPNLKLSIVPLERLLRKAIQADPNLVRHPDKSDSYAMSKAIALAKEEMIPVYSYTPSSKT